MIVVTDYYRFQNEHCPGNAAKLYITAKYYSTEEVHFYAQDEHVKCVQAYLNDNGLVLKNIIWHPQNFPIRGGEGKWFLFKRILNEFFLLRRLSNKLKKSDVNLLFLLSLSPCTSILFKKFLFRKTKVLITLHGDVEFIKGNYTFIRNILGLCFKYSFSIKRNECYYLALNDVIRVNLLKTKLLSNSEIFGSLQPYIYKIANRPSRPLLPPVNLGHIGVASVEKQSHFFFQLAKRFEKEIYQKKIVFNLIGKIENIPDASLNSLVEGGKNEMLSRKEYEDRIQNIDYSVFFHSNRNYQFTTSGAILDAIDFEKPVIALQNDFFQSLFDKAGQIGFLCASIEELNAIIYKVLDGKISESEYRAMQDNMHYFKQKYGVEQVGEIIFQQLK